MGKFAIVKTATGFTFHLKASNGEVIATSEVYNSKGACKKGIDSVKRNSAVAHLEDQTVEGFKKEKNPKFELYLDKAGESRFRLRATNGQEIASSQAYKEKSGCEKGIESVRKNAPEAEIIDQTEEK